MLRVGMEASYLELKAKSREKQLKMAIVFKVFKPISSDLLPLMRTHLLKLQTVPSTGDQVFKYLSHGGHFSFKPLALAKGETWEQSNEQLFFMISDPVDSCLQVPILFGFLLWHS